MLYVFDQPINKEKVIKDLKEIFKVNDVDESFTRRLTKNIFTDKLILSKELNIVVDNEFVLVAFEYADAVNTKVFLEIDTYLIKLMEEVSIMKIHKEENKSKKYIKFTDSNINLEEILEIITKFAKDNPDITYEVINGICYEIKINSKDKKDFCKSNTKYSFLQKSLEKEMKNPDNKYLLGNQKYYNSKEIEISASEIESLFNRCGSKNIYISKPAETYIGIFDNFSITIHQPSDNKHCIETIGCINSNLSIEKLKFGKVTEEFNRKQYEVNNELYNLIYDKDTLIYDE